MHASVLTLSASESIAEEAKQPKADDLYSNTYIIIIIWLGKKRDGTLAWIHCYLNIYANDLRHSMAAPGAGRGRDAPGAGEGVIKQGNGY